MVRGDVDGLSGYTKPGAKRVRMRTGLVMPMRDLVSSKLRQRKSRLDKKDPCQRDDQMNFEYRVYARKRDSH